MTTHQLTDEQKQTLKELVLENERLRKEVYAITKLQHEVNSKAEAAGLDRSALIYAMSYRERPKGMGGRERLELVLVYLQTLEEMGAQEEPEEG